MAVRLLLVLGVLAFFCLTEASVSSNLYTEQGILPSSIPYGQALVVRGRNRRLMQNIDCGGLCKLRCSAHSRPKLCSRACGTCCTRCRCVPPGTSGNRELCGRCYTDMTTHGNKFKCP